MILYKHIKSGNLYYVIDDDMINATNELNGQRYVLYCSAENMNKKFCREYQEFNEKFEVIF